MIFIGVDVGAAGGIAFIGPSMEVLLAVKMPETDAELFAVLSSPGIGVPTTQRFAVLEKVHSSPQMGVASAFSFGGAYRACRMALTAARIPFDEVDPKRWQRRMECLSGGDKNVTKLRAQQLFPGVKITHAIADALLLADYARRTYRDSTPEADGAPTAGPGV